MKTQHRVKIGIDAENSQEVSTQTSRETSTCAEGKMETSTALLVSFNKEKKRWQTPDGRLFDTLKKAEAHLKNI